MNRTLLYYVSGHGFGHGRRAAAVIAALLERVPGLTVHVRTSAPAFLFDELPPARVRLHAASVDPGCVEADTLTIDAYRTAERVAEFFGRADEITVVEVEFARALRPSLVVADVPFLAGEIARRSEVPCVAVSNFTWDWIYEDLFGRDERFSPLIDRIRDDYAKMAGLVRLPWGGVAGVFPRVLDAPLVANPSRRGRDEILRRLGLIGDDRPRVLVGMRGGMPAETLAVAAAASPGIHFLTPGPPAQGAPANILPVPPAPEIEFADLVRIADVVLSKLGYGIVADCIAERTRLLWPRRTGFREDDLSRVEAARYIPLRELPPDDYRSGNWAPHLSELLARPMPAEIARTDGARVCARILSEWLSAGE